jgi:hypothetical protein
VAEIVSLPGGSFGGVVDDTAAKLRAIADQVEAGEFGPVRLGVFVLVAAGVEVFGVGPDGGDVLASVGALHVGMARLTGAADG